MIIECNKCKSLFRLDEGLLRVNGSKVRCSVCKYIFIAYPPGWEPGADEKSRPLDQTLGDTVILESPPVLEDEEREPLLEDAGDQDFEAAFDEEAVTKRLQAVPSLRFPQQEEGEEEEEDVFHLEMDDQQKKEIEPEPAVVKPGAAKPKRMEKEAKPESPPRAAKEVGSKTKKPGRSKLPLIIVLVLLLLIGGATAVILFAPEHVPEQLAFLKAARKTETTDPGVVRLRFTSVTGSFVQNAKAGQVFVVRGAISNNYNSNRSHVLVKGSILDDKGKVVKTKVAYAGNVFAESELQSLSMEQIDQGLRNRTGKENVNVNIKPQASVPFMIVFEDLPDNLSEFTVEPVSSSPGQ
jgi:predicted Zn finger-like uncharacterized protein